MLRKNSRKRLSKLIVAIVYDALIYHDISFCMEKITRINHIMLLSVLHMKHAKNFRSTKNPHFSMIRFKLQICWILGHTIEVQRQPSGVRTCQVISHLRGHSNCSQQCNAVDPPSSSDTCDAELCKCSANLLTTELHNSHRHPCALSNLNMAKAWSVFSNGDI